MSWLDERDEHESGIDAAQTEERLEVRLRVTRAELEALRTIATRAFEGALDMHEVMASVRLFDAMEDL